MGRPARWLAAAAVFADAAWTAPPSKEQGPLPPGFSARSTAAEQVGARRLLGPGAFGEAQPRRLEATDSKPARDLYVADYGGRRFAYEYAGRRTASRIVNLDRDDSAAAVDCGALPSRPGEDGLLRIIWLDDASASATTGLRTGDIVAAREQWECSFLVEVLRVEGVEDVGQPSTSAVVRATSPLQVFRDLYISLEWTTPSAERRLDGGQWEYSPSIPFLGFNINEDGTIRQPYLDVGIYPVQCEDCYVALQPAVRFTLETGGGGEVERVAMELSGDLNVSASLVVSPAVKDAVRRGWVRVEDSQGPDLIALGLSAAGAVGGAAAVAGSGGWLAPVAPLLLPLFDELASSLDIELRPAMGLDYLLETIQDIILNGKLSLDVATGPDGNIFRVSWDPESGFTANVSTDVSSSLRFSGSDLSNNISLGLRSCVELQLTAYNNQLTSLSACPELTAFFNRVAGGISQSQLPDSVQPTPDDDTQLCLEFVKFTTDINADLFGRDHAFGYGCMLGKCVSTSSLTFTGDTVTWNDEPLCLPTQSAALRVTAVSLEVKEDNSFFYDRPYADPLDLILASQECPDLERAGCTKTLDLAPNSSSQAELTVTFTTRSLTRRAAEQTCSGGVSAGVAVGVHSSFGGVRFPTSFNVGGGQLVVDPAERPTVRSSEPELVCAQAQAPADGGAAIVSAAFGGVASQSLLWWASLACCAFSATASAS